MSAEDKTVENKDKMTDEEREKLAKKLDDELETFINNLPKNKIENNLSMEELANELENHPFFLKETPDPNKPLHPLVEGLQKLKYDPDENQPEELALSYKEDGNFHFKIKRYNLAIVAYTEGLKQKFDNQQIRLSLLNNRSAAHYYLKNYRSCLNDCKEVLAIEKYHKRALRRATQCAFVLEEYDVCIDYCNDLLDSTPYDDEDERYEYFDLRYACIDARDKKFNNDRIKYAQFYGLVTKLGQTINERGYHIKEFDDEEEDERVFNITPFETGYPGLQPFKVRLDMDTNRLIWPVVLFYPEYGTMDHIESFSENSSVAEELVEVFEETPEWDKDKKYTYKSVNVYVLNKNSKFIQIDVGHTLRQIFQNPDFVISRGTPCFYILLKGCEMEKYLLSQQNS